MNKNIILFILIFNFSFIHSIDIKLEQFIDDKSSWESFSFYNNSSIVYVSDFRIFLYYIENNKHIQLFQVPEYSKKLNSDGLNYDFFINKSDKSLMVRIFYYIENNLVEDFFIYKDSLYRILKEDFKGFVSKRTVRDIKYRSNWKFNLLGDYIYSYDGDFYEIIPFISNNDEFKVYFENTTNKSEKYLKPYTDSLYDVDISPDKFTIAFWGWSTRGIEYGATVGKMEGIFIFKLTYDGIITEDTGVYNIIEEDLLEDSQKLLSKDLKVKVKAIKEIQNNKYYQIEYEDGKNGWVSESAVKIGSE